MKPKKMTFQDPNFYGGYFKFSRAKGKGGEKGYIYTLCKNLTDKEKEEIITKYNNTGLLIASPKYAPEIRHNAVLIYDKAIFKAQRI